MHTSQAMRRFTPGLTGLLAEIRCQTSHGMYMQICSFARPKAHGAIEQHQSAALAHNYFAHAYALSSSPPARPLQASLVGPSHPVRTDTGKLMASHPFILQPARGLNLQTDWSKTAD